MPAPNSQLEELPVTLSGLRIYEEDSAGESETEKGEVGWTDLRQGVNSALAELINLSDSSDDNVEVEDSTHRVTKSETPKNNEQLAFLNKKGKNGLCFNCEKRKVLSRKLTQLSDLLELRDQHFSHDFQSVKGWKYNVPISKFIKAYKAQLNQLSNPVTSSMTSNGNGSNVTPSFARQTSTSSANKQPPTQRKKFYGFEQRTPAVAEFKHFAQMKSYIRQYRREVTAPTMGIRFLAKSPTNWGDPVRQSNLVPPTQNWRDPPPDTAEVKPEVAGIQAQNNKLIRGTDNIIQAAAAQLARTVFGSAQVIQGQTPPLQPRTPTSSQGQRNGGGGDNPINFERYDSSNPSGSYSQISLNDQFDPLARSGGALERYTTDVYCLKPGSSQQTQRSGAQDALRTAGFRHQPPLKPVTSCVSTSVLPKSTSNKPPRPDSGSKSRPPSSKSRPASTPPELSAEEKAKIMAEVAELTVAESRDWIRSMNPKIKLETLDAALDRKLNRDVQCSPPYRMPNCTPHTSPCAAPSRNCMTPPPSLKTPPHKFSPSPRSKRIILQKFAVEGANHALAQRGRSIGRGDWHDDDEKEDEDDGDDSTPPNTTSINPKNSTPTSRTNSHPSSTPDANNARYSDIKSWIMNTIHSVNPANATSSSPAPPKVPSTNSLATQHSMTSVPGDKTLLTPTVPSPTAATNSGAFIKTLEILAVEDRRKPKGIDSQLISRERTLIDSRTSDRARSALTSKEFNPGGAFPSNNANYHSSLNSARSIKKGSQKQVNNLPITELSSAPCFDTFLLSQRGLPLHSRINPGNGNIRKSKFMSNVSKKNL